MLKEVSDLQIFALASVPNMITVIVAILISNAGLRKLQREFEALSNRLDECFNELDRRFDMLDAKFEHLERT